jgi:hypothetical protein
MEPDSTSPAVGKLTRLSKLAVTALALAPVLVTGTVGIALFGFIGEWKSGWEGLTKLILFLFWGQVAIFGGSIIATLAIILAWMALRKIRKQPDQLTGRPLARLAIKISVTSLLGVWGIIGGTAAVFASKDAPRRAAESDIRAAFQAVVQHSLENNTFPDSLAQVVSSETAGRYTYFGKGLPSEYADYRTAGSRIIVMHSTGSVDGKFAVICANGMTHEWTKEILEVALRESDTLRGNL